METLFSWLHVNELIACSILVIKGNEATHDFWSMKCFIFDLGWSCWCLSLFKSRMTIHTTSNLLLYEKKYLKFIALNFVFNLWAVMIQRYVLCCSGLLLKDDYDVNYSKNWLTFILQSNYLLNNVCVRTSIDNFSPKYSQSGYQWSQNGKRNNVKFFIFHLFHK